MQRFFQQSPARGLLPVWRRGLSQRLGRVQLLAGQLPVPSPMAQRQALRQRRLLRVVPRQQVLRPEWRPVRQTQPAERSPVMQPALPQRAWLQPGLLYLVPGRTLTVPSAVPVRGYGVVSCLPPELAAAQPLQAHCQTYPARRGKPVHKASNTELFLRQFT